MKATVNGKLRELTDCYLKLRNGYKLTFKNLPDIGDSKSAEYSDEQLPGRSFPSKTYSGSGSRSISLSFNLYSFDTKDLKENIKHLNNLQSTVYPMEGRGSLPYAPPPICSLKCGELLSSSEINGVIKNCNVKFPTNVPWYSETTESGSESLLYFPYKIEITLDFDVVYASSELPGQEKIINERNFV